MSSSEGKERQQQKESSRVATVSCSSKAEMLSKALQDQLLRKLASSPPKKFGSLPILRSHRRSWYFHTWNFFVAFPTSLHTLTSACGSPCLRFKSITNPSLRNPDLYYYFVLQCPSPSLDRPLCLLSARPSLQSAFGTSSHPQLYTQDPVSWAL